GLPVKGNVIRRKEHVRRIATSLGPLALRDGVLDGVRIETELAGQRVQPGPVRRADIHPHKAIRFFEVVGDLLEREVIGLDDAGPTAPRANVVLHWAILPASSHAMSMKGDTHLTTRRVTSFS